MLKTHLPELAPQGGCNRRIYVGFAQRFTAEHEDDDKITYFLGWIREYREKLQSQNSDDTPARIEKVKKKIKTLSLFEKVNNSILNIYKEQLAELE